MMKTKDLIVLTLLTIALALFATLAGLTLPGVYRDPSDFVLIWKRNDLVTLLAALPILILAMVAWICRRSLKSLLSWFAMLWFLSYNYAYYVYGAAFNVLYLVHVAIYTLSLAALILGLARFPASELAGALKPKFGRGFVIGEMLFVAVGLTAIYAMQSLSFVIDGTLPPIIAASGHVTSVVFSIDISMVVLFFVLGAVLLAKRSPWGVLIGFIANLKGAVYMAVLVVASLRTNPAETPIWAVLGLLSLASFALLWAGIRDRSLALPGEPS